MSVKLITLLDGLQQELIQIGAWQSKKPSSHALASREPFAIDRLSALEWLQWIFIPKLRQLIENNQSLPSSLQISPYISEALKHSAKYEPIILICEQIDFLFSSNLEM